MATYFSIPAWKIPWTEESGRLQQVVSSLLHGCRVTRGPTSSTLQRTKRRCKGCCDRSPHSPFRNEALIFPTAGTIGYSQPIPLLDLLSAKLHPFTRSSQYLISCGRGQRSGPMGSTGSISERLLQLQSSPWGGWGHCIDYISLTSPLSLPSRGF